MAVVRRNGKWTLEKQQNGVYEIRERGNLQARVITDDYEPQGMMNDLRMDVMTQTIEVRDFKDAEREFQNYIKKSESSGFGLGGGLF
ncbi:hypothetical protein [Haladaptatus sp. T7]|uniref:hypothetical protein n=1 Tax=Haladaptatus sp. T7 TaxID=2029368 RepID=UPI0021A257DD|nr:hypothetical protein [Haladaptatus sp. T7]GKZ14333.1 hypothetical protein HAL_22140 [Haladaptatus sp. T7]